MDLRAFRRGAAEDRDRQPRQPRRPSADQGRALSGAQDARGVRLRLPALDPQKPGPAPRPARLPGRQGERRPARPARHRQDAPLDRARASAPAWPATASRSGPRPNGSRCSPTPNATAASTQSSTGCSAIPLLIVDEVGYIPFDPQAANLMFMLVSRRYERASLIVTSNKPFSPGARSSATRSPPPR